MPDLTRRQVLVGSAAAAAAGALTPTLVESPAAAATSADILVIGTGYAGAVAALRIAQAGLSCVVLERGRRWDITDRHDTFCTFSHLDGRAAWLSASTPLSSLRLPTYTGVLEAYVAKGITCLGGAGVGGSSLVNYAVQMQPSQALFQKSFGSCLDYAEMDQTWYPRARALIGVSPIPQDVLAAPAYANVRQFIAEAAKAGLPATLPEMAMDWDIVRAELSGKLPPAAIEGDCILGINSGAKRSVDRTILAEAEATGRVTVLPLHNARSIAATADRYTVTADQIDESGQVLSRPTFSARYVFLAAGSLGTSGLLVKARATGTLPGLSPRIGTSWGNGGDHIIARTGFPLPSAAQGGPANAVVTDWNNSIGPVTLLNFPLGIPPLAGVVREMLAVGSPPPIGSFTYSGAAGAAQLSWPSGDARLQPITAAVKQTANRLAKAGSLITTQVVVPGLTAHPLGGAVLGQAVGDDGGLIGHPNVFVVDSALIPGSTGSVPPALTVTALADRMVTKALNKILA